MAQGHRLAARGDRLLSGEQGAQSSAADVGQLGKVQQDALAGLDLTEQGILEIRSGGGVQAPIQLEDGLAVFGAFADVHNDITPFPNGICQGWGRPARSR